MWTRDFEKTGSRVFLLMGQFFVLLFCFLYIDYVYLTNIRPDKLAKETFQETQCFVVNKKLSAKGHLTHKFRADFLISYNVNGVQYNRWVSGNGLDMSFSGNGTEQGDMLAQYEVGNTYPCWYSPDNPQIAVLVMRHSWTSMFPLLVPAVIGAILLYYFLKNLAQLTGMATVKTRELVREKKKHKEK